MDRNGGLGYNLGTTCSPPAHGVRGPTLYTVTVVPEKGIEPSRPCGHRILGPARLPVPPLRREVTITHPRAAPIVLVAVVARATNTFRLDSFVEATVTSATIATNGNLELTISNGDRVRIYKEPQYESYRLKIGTEELIA